MSTETTANPAATTTTANPAATTTTALSNLCKTSKLLLDVYNSKCDSFSYDDQLIYNEQIALFGPGTDDNCDLPEQVCEQVTTTKSTTTTTAEPTTTTTTTTTTIPEECIEVLDFFAAYEDKLGHSKQECEANRLILQSHYSNCNFDGKCDHLENPQFSGTQNAFPNFFLTLAFFTSFFFKF
ncbi:Oidioi.mRNA.OKI2018_I69.XSR.g16588.t1.cds [Oikopleura dioica]|uniref:Oidioi.mRNA.OKI2018_I69.XSR.g16588.t1.cds n=1 Tax=Oikopleura dioica TaxID=34765 RepID=A0ABN7SKT3_OIKDI|nr:Oidioi.mRNA.OKI2018_I69.XSR.g16588.t1.cds [Oikopleura dioica]